MVSTTDEIVNEVAPVEVQQQQQPAELKSISEEEFEKAQKLFQLGKKNLFLNKYDESVNNIGDACKTYASKFGEMDPQCAEVYFFYGRALLELARIENTVLGNALTGVPEENEPINDSRYGNPEEMTADEKNEISEKVIEALCSTEEEIKNGETTITTTKTEETTGETKTGEESKVEETTTKPTTTEEKVEEAKQETATAEKMETATAETDDTTTPKPESSDKTTEEKKEGEEGEEEAEEDDADEEETGEEETAEGANKEDAEDISNLQSSWEMFELAKLIYTKNFDEDKLFKSKRIAECLLKLGEISIEQEIYEQAITDIAESIRVQEEIECADRDERMLAESYYQLGLAKQFNNMMTEAKDAYQRSINIVQLRVEKLKGKLAGLDGSSGEECESEKTRINEEIGELEALMPEMSSKLEECNEPCAETLERIKEAKECFASGTTEGLATATTTNGDVKDITSLVKSKRKIENGSEEAGDCNGNTKKTKMSDEGEESSEEKMEEKCVEETTCTTTTTITAETTTETTTCTTTITAETTTTTTAAETCAEKIEIDENKEENKENVETKTETEGLGAKMEEGKTEVTNEAVVETATAPITETSTTAEPIASA